MARAEIYNLTWWRGMAEKSRYNAGWLAREINISRRQLQRYTQRFFGLSPQGWLNQQRLSIAGDLLKQFRSVKRVAFQLGFKQISHFSREFKAHYGLCPVSYLQWHDRQQAGANSALNSIDTFPQVISPKCPPQINRVHAR